MNKRNLIVATFVFLVLGVFLVSAFPPIELTVTPIAEGRDNATFFAVHTHAVVGGEVVEQWELYPEFEGNTPSASKIIFYDNDRIEIISAGNLVINGKKVCLEDGQGCP